MERIDNEVESKHIKNGPFLGMRHIQAILLFLNFVILFINRVHVAITLVAMTNANKSNPDFPKYNWNEQHKSYILSSFYWGYVLTQLPGAYCVRRFGVKISLFVFSTGTGLLTLLVPFCITWGGWQAFCLLRFLQGLFQGGFYPATLQHLAKWSPPAERNVLAGITHTGFDCGIVFAMAISGVIATSALGWPGIFYIYAALCFIWCALWQVLGANDINKSKLIANDERLYIEDSIKTSISFEQGRLPVPWRAIFTSKPFFALLVVRAITVAGIITIQAEWPSYMNGVLKLDISNNSLYSALPFVASWFSTIIFTFIANSITKKNLMSLTIARKCFNAIGIWIPAICLFLIGFIYDIKVVIITMILIVALHSSTNMGSIIAPIDMAPNHAEIIISVVNTIANCLVLLGPLFIGIIVNDEKNRGQWQIAFITIAAVLCIGDLTFLIWGTAEEQPWTAAGFSAVKSKTRLNAYVETSFNSSSSNDQLKSNV